MSKEGKNKILVRGLEVRGQKKKEPFNYSTKPKVSNKVIGDE